MKALIFALATFLGFAAFVSDANAYVCARGWRGAAALVLMGQLACGGLITGRTATMAMAIAGGSQSDRAARTSRPSR